MPGTIDRLVELTADLPVKDVDVDSIWEVDSVYWFNDGDEVPTVRSIVDHMRLVNQVDTSYPIILGSNGCVMDGMHRVVRALLEGHRTMRAVQFEVDPEPDHRNRRPKSVAVLARSHRLMVADGHLEPAMDTSDPEALLAEASPERDTGAPMGRWHGATVRPRNPGSDDRCRGFRSTVKWRQSQIQEKAMRSDVIPGLRPPRPRQELSRVEESHPPSGAAAEAGSPSAKWRSGGDGAPAVPLLRWSAASAGAVLGRNRSRAGRRGHAAGAIT